MKKISCLHYISQQTTSYTHVQSVKEACKRGIEWVQLRVKNQTFDNYLAIAQHAKAICKQYNATLIINDNVEVAKEIDADGVHLGQQDMPPLLARKILGKDKIIGSTANTFSDILQLNDCQVNYIGLGPYRFTTTKKNLAPILGIKNYTTILEKIKQHKINIPIIAVGGIEKKDMKNLLKTGIYGVAVSSVIAKSLVNPEEKNLICDIKEILQCH